MSTSPNKLKYLWIAYIDGEKHIVQPADDRHPDHDDNAEWNPSAFRQVQDKLDRVTGFALFPANERPGNTYFVSLTEGWFSVNGRIFWLQDPDDVLTDRKLVFYRPAHQKQTITQNPETRKMETVTHPPEVIGYVMGYEATDQHGKRVLKTITIGA